MIVPSDSQSYYNLRFHEKTANEFGGVYSSDFINWDHFRECFIEVHGEIYTVLYKVFIDTPYSDKLYITRVRELENSKIIYSSSFLVAIKELEKCIDVYLKSS